jgi:hypothetical protein
MPKITEDQKSFISTKHLKDGMKNGEICVAFEEEFGYSPSNKVINKWKYHEQEQPAEETKGGDTGEVDPITGDTRTVKDKVVSFTAEGMEDDAAFYALCKTHGHSHEEMANMLQRAAARGYTKINITTGDITK